MSSITLQPSRNTSAPTAFIRRDDGREFYLHSRYDPFEEAQFLAKDVARQERTLYVVLGFGLGYHVRAILNHVPASSHVVVIEPAAMCLSARAATEGHPATAWMHDPRLHLLSHHDPKLTPLHLADRMAALRLLSIKLVTHVPSTLTAEDYYRTVASEIPQHFPANIQRHLSALDRTLESDLRNFWANLRYSWRATPVSQLRGSWRGRPLVIVSGGPSLTDALPRLADLRERALMLATGSTARVMTERGVRPDLVISVDPYALNLAHFVGWDTSQVPLVYYHRVHHAILPAYGGRLCAFTMQDEPPLPLAEGERVPFHRGGTVAFSALQLAHYLEADPIIFVGQDFAFAGGRTHAEGAIYGEFFDETAPPDDYILIPGVDGRPVMTSRIHQAYLLHMQDYLLNYEKARPAVRHINTSRLGARMRGSDYQTIETTVGEMAPLPSGLSRDLCVATTPPRAAVPNTRRALLDRWINELSRVLATAGGQDFDALMRAFAQTSMFDHAATAYGDLRYVYETKYQSGANTAAGIFSNRFRDHLRQVLADLRDARDAVSESRPARTEYSRHAVPVADPSDLAQVVERLADLPGVVAVNIVDSAENPPVALSEQSLLTALAARPAAITVEALPRDVYQRVMRDKIELAVREALALRTILCSCAIGDVPTEAGTVVRHLDQILFLVRGYALQDRRAVLSKLIEALTARRLQLAESCFESGDNVRCMDDLHYEVIPVLADLFKLFS